MKKIIALTLLLVASNVFAEASFDQIERLIEQGQYQAAESGLVEIIKNHPQSARAYYAMAQAQAGMGNLEKARYALNKSRGLDPSLKFASSSNVELLEQAITPQTQKIEAVESSHWFLWTLFILATLGLGYWAYTRYQQSGDSDQDDDSYGYAHSPRPVAPVSPSGRYATPPPASTPTPRGLGATARARVVNHGGAGRVHTPAPSVTPTTTVINNHSNNDLLTGVLLGDMMNHHNNTIIERDIIEREVIRPTVDSSWDDTPKYSSSGYSSSWDDSSSSSSSSSWDDNSSSSRSSSWDDSSSSSRSSSWDDSSSSSSSSSWDDSSSSSSSSDSW
jgi:uncharacterized protein